MAYGKNKIVLTGDPMGRIFGCYISGTPKPGTVMEITSAVLKNGLVTVQASQTPADGAARLIAVLMEDDKQGCLPTVAYVSGAYGTCYCPMIGDILNMLVQNLAGTADDHAIGELLMVDTPTGMLILNSAGKQTFTNLETITDPTADTLSACMFNG